MASPIGSVPAPGAGGGGPAPQPAPPPPPAPPTPPTRPVVPPAAPVAAEGQKGTPIFLPDDWVGKVTDRIVTTVDGVRSKTTTPIEKVGRMVVWGLLIATAGTSLLIALLIGALRLLYALVGNIPGLDRPGRSVWMIDLLLGVLLIAVGLALLKKGTKPQSAD